MYCMKRILLPVLGLLILAGCSNQPGLTASGLNPKDFKSTYNGAATGLYTLTNEKGMEVCITNFGGRIVSVMVPDQEGVLQDVVLGFDKVSDYFPENNQTDFGAAIGRYANRIAGGKLTLDGTEYQLSQNNNGHCLHGGATGWQYQVYDVVESDASHLKLKIVSPDGDNGFPGTVTAFVTYTLTPKNQIDIRYEATTDAPTVINMTNHSYFNLSGDPGNHEIIQDVLCVNADSYTPVDSTLIPTGEIKPVVRTPFDLTTPTLVATFIEAKYDQVQYAGGYDHNFVLNTKGDDSKLAALLYSPASGITMMVYTDEPGIQVYSGNFLDGSIQGKKGIAYPRRSAICLETQHYPDSPNKSDWPSTVLRPGETYSSHTVLSFSTRKQ